MHIGTQSFKNLEVIACMHGKKFGKLSDRQNLSTYSDYRIFLSPVIELLQGLTLYRINNIL